MRKGDIAPVIAGLILASASLGSSTLAATYVLPVVVGGVPGMNGSFWDAELRVVQLSTSQPVTVKRVWVGLLGGGFVDDVATAPHWELVGGPGYIDNSPEVIVLKATDLLQGVAATHAAIGLDIQGPVDVNLWLGNSEGQGRLFDNSQNCCLPGNGQLVHITPQLIQGDSHVPWSTAGTGVFRSSLGVVNPNAEPLQVSVFVANLGPAPFSAWEWRTTSTLGPLVLTLPPWGWVQVDDLYHHLPCLALPLGGLCPPPSERTDPVQPGLVVLRPSSSAPYVAYESLIYSPKNDPEFIPALAGGIGNLFQ